MRYNFLRFAAALVVAGAVAAQTFNAPGYVSPSPSHRAVFSPGDPLLKTLQDAGALTRLDDYGSFAVATFDERPLGGREALFALGLDLRDYEAVVGLSDAAFDAAHPPTLDAVLRAVPPAFFADEDDARSSGRPSLWIVQFAGPVRDAWLERLEATGATIVQYIPSNAYVVAVEASEMEKFTAFRADADVSWSGLYQPWWKLDTALRPGHADQSRTIPVIVQFLMGARADSVRAGLELAGCVRLGPDDGCDGYLNAEYALPAGLLPVLASDPSVFFIELRRERRRNDEIQSQIVAGNLNAGGTAPTGPGFIAWLTGKGFSSVGQFAFAVDVTDDGVDRGSTTDVNDEFRVLGASGGTSRVAYNNNYTSDALADGGDGHGNINASIIGGYNNLAGTAYNDAAGYNYGLGVCPFVQIGNTKVFDNNGNADFTSGTSTRLSAAYSGGARISNNSWGESFNNNYSTGTQTHDSRVRDAQTGTGGNQELSIVFAAGNDGSGANTVSAPATGKNILCVGASENVRQNGTDGCGYGNTSANNSMDVIAFSSRGPCSDGRIKPDVMAPGVHIIGAASRSLAYDGGGVCDQYEPAGQTLYCQSTGTSHSAPAVAGGAALVRQYFINQGWGTPSPAMTKAVIMNTARYMTGVGGGGDLPSNTQGTGLLDLGRAFDGVSVQRVDQTHVFGSTGQTHVVTGSVADAGKPFRVALVWTDAAGATSGNAWVNNLNLTVAVGGSTYLGNVITNSLSTTGGTADSQNNAEFVFLPAGTSGSFTVTVTAANIVGNGVPGNADTTDQDFALYVYNGSSCPAPSINTQPVSVGACLGGLAQFTVAATGSGTLTYQWRKDSVNVGGATSATYSIPSVAAGHLGSYDCVIGSVCGSATSDSAALTLVTAPSFLVHPFAQSVCAGANVTFSVAANGGGLAYQWRKNGIDVVGATASSYLQTGVGPAAAGSYNCVISNACASVPSNPATLTINSAPSITTQPVAQSICSGAPVTFTVVGAGTGLGYQWRKNGSPIAGATADSYTINPTSTVSAGTYSVVVSNSCGSVTSANALLTISVAPVFFVQPPSPSVCVGASINLNGVATGSPAPTYQWRKNGVDIVGATSTTYSIPSAATTDAGTYVLMASNLCGAVPSSSAVVTVGAAAVVTSHPANASACAGQGASFTVVASGASPTYQWRKNLVAVPGATAPTYAIVSVVAGDAGSYDCVVSTSCGSSTSNAASLNVDSAPSITSSPSPETVCTGAFVVLNAAATGTGPLAYQWRKNLAPISGATSPSYSIPSALASDGGSYDCVVTNACGSATTAAAAVFVSTPTISSVAPSLISVMTTSSPSVPLTIIGSCFTPTSGIVVNGVLLATGYVSATELTCLIPASIPQTQRFGGLVVNVQQGITDVSNSKVVRVGGGLNKGTIRRQPLIPNPGDFFQGVMEDGVPFSPMSVFIDFSAAVPAFPWPNATQGLVLAVSPEIGSPGPIIALFDGLGIFGAPDGIAYDANGAFVTPPIQLPNPLIGVTMVLQGVYLDGAAPGGFRLTWARWPDLF